MLNDFFYGILFLMHPLYLCFTQSHRSSTLEFDSVALCDPYGLPLFYATCNESSYSLADSPQYYSPLPQMQTSLLDVLNRYSKPFTLAFSSYLDYWFFQGLVHPQAQNHALHQDFFSPPISNPLFSPDYLFFDFYALPPSKRLELQQYLINFLDHHDSSHALHQSQFHAAGMKILHPQHFLSASFLKSFFSNPQSSLSSPSF